MDRILVAVCFLICVNCSLAEEVRETRTITAKILYQDIYFNNLLLASNLGEDLRTGVKQAAYNRMFYFWFLSCSDQASLPKDSMLQNNYGEQYERYFKGDEPYLGDPLLIEGQYKNGSLTEDYREFYIGDISLKIIEKKKDYEILVRKFREDLGTWMPKARKKY